MYKEKDFHCYGIYFFFNVNLFEFCPPCNPGTKTATFPQFYVYTSIEILMTNPPKTGLLFLLHFMPSIDVELSQFNLCAYFSWSK